ncbi:MAG: ATP-binding protein [Oceanisphaera sp.]|uniref:ATP-binding protein n=1 Tax=Oceanisphaera sp. TaxID=1929979 RepID=UPI003F9C56B4
MLFILLLIVVWFSSWQRQWQEQEQSAQQQLLVYRTALESEIARFENVPRALQEHPVLLGALTYANDPEAIKKANLLLEQLATATGIEALYMMNDQGVVLATSNWRQPHSFAGQNYLFRPYVYDAMEGSFGEYYGVGATTGIPGYFFGLPVGNARQPQGVLAAKITLLDLEQSWTLSKNLVMAVDSDQVVTLSSSPDLKFKTLAPLTDEALARIAQTRQYYPLPLTPLALSHQQQQQLVWQGIQYQVSEVYLPKNQWRLQLWSPSRPLIQHATLVTSLTAFSIIAMILLLLYWRQRRRYILAQLRAKEELEYKVSTRTSALALSNQQLEHQVTERFQVEAKLRAMQHELIHTNRLAALGQMAASVAHEVNQPLTALKNQSINTKLLLNQGQHTQVVASLEVMGTLVDRIARLTSQLKNFAATRRKTRGECRLDEALENVLSWLNPRLTEQNISLDRSQARDLLLPIELHALEQILANILENSADALTDQPQPMITLSAQPSGLAIYDNGPGIAPELLDKVTEPFFSTKQYGKGLGLGLAIVRDLIEASDGNLTLYSPPAGGTHFILSWKVDS